MSGCSCSWSLTMYVKIIQNVVESVIFESTPPLLLLSSPKTNEAQQIEALLCRGPVFLRHQQRPSLGMSCGWRYNGLADGHYFPFHRLDMDWHNRNPHPASVGCSPKKLSIAVGCYWPPRHTQRLSPVGSPWSMTATLGVLGMVSHWISIGESHLIMEILQLAHLDGYLSFLSMVYAQIWCFPWSMWSFWG